MFSSFSIKAAGAKEAFASSAPAAKVQRPSGGAAASKRGCEEPEMEALPEKQVAWIHRGMTNMLQQNFATFGEAVEHQFGEIEKRVDAKIEIVEKKADAASSEVAKIQDDVGKKLSNAEANITNRQNDFEAKISGEIGHLTTTSEATFKDQKNAHDEELKSVREELRSFKEEAQKSISDLRVAASSGHPSGPAPSSGAYPGTLPMHLRTKACLGNLGWDTPQVDLQQRAKAILDEVGFEVPRDYVRIDSPYERPSSFVNVECSAPAKIAELGRKLEELRRTLIPDNPRKFVFANIAKTREERAPTRIVGTAARLLSQFESQRSAPERIEIEGKPLQRCVKGGDQVIGVVDFENKFVFTSFGNQRYSRDDRLIVSCSCR